VSRACYAIDQPDGGVSEMLYARLGLLDERRGYPRHPGHGRLRGGCCARRHGLACGGFFCGGFARN